MNVDRSMLPCASNGSEYVLAGHLTARADRLRTVAPTVVLVHDVDHGEWFWRFQPGSPRDFAAALARRGLRVLTLDRLGYGASPHLNGSSTCLGAQADMIHQVLQLVRTGGYELDGRAAPPAARVGVVADAGGSAIVELSSYSWPKDASALVLMSWSDPAPSAQAGAGVARAVTSCTAGGDATAGAPGYAYFATSAAAYRDDFLFSAPANIQAAVAALREPDPCGDDLSLIPLVAANIAHAPQIRQPVLLLYGRHDPLLTPDAPQHQAQLLRSSSSVTTKIFANSSGDLTLDGDFLSVQQQTGDWLCRELDPRSDCARR